MRGEGEADVPGAAGDASVSRRDFLRVTALAMALPAAGGCLPGPTDVDSDPAPSSARLTARPSTPTLTPDPGESWLNINTFGRDGLLYVPDGYDAATAAPLLVTLHGRGGAGSDWAAFQSKCDLRGIVMLSIDSRDVTWDRVSGVFGADVGFIDAALAHAFARCLIDPARIALAGFSDGASYALSLGPVNGDLFTHLIAFSPGFSAPTREVFGKPVIWVSHGTQDPILPESSTRNDIVPTLRDADYLVDYTPFDGGHQVPAEVSNAALDWFVG